MPLKIPIISVLLMAPKHKRVPYAIRFHGRWCGPGWSDGKYQYSVGTRGAADDEFDRTCRRHDNIYDKDRPSLKKYRRLADRQFYRDNYGKGFWRTLAAKAVGNPTLTDADAQSFSLSKTSQMANGQRPRSRSLPSPAQTPKRGRSATRQSSKNAARGSRSRSLSRMSIVPGPKFVSIAGYRSSKGYRGNQSAAGKMRGSRKRKSTQDSMKYKGAATVIKEYGTVNNSTNQVRFLGHATHCALHTREVLWGAIYNRLMEKAAIFPSSGVNTGVSLLATDSIVIQFRYGADDSTLAFDTYAPGAVSVTQSLFVTWATAAARPFNAPSAQGDGFKFLRIYVFGTVFNPQLRSNTEVRLEKLMVKLYAKSSMKFQNRSITTAGATEEDEVDNVPVYGKLYGGKGNGTKWGYQGALATQSFIADPLTNVITAVSSADLNEPPYPAEFTKIQEVGKFKLEPGQIKTSNLTVTETKLFDTWMNISWPLQVATPHNWHSTAGKYRFFAMEKMMNVSNAVPVIIAFELQTTMMATVKETYTRVQTSTFSSTIV